MSDVTRFLRHGVAALLGASSYGELVTYLHWEQTMGGGADCGLGWETKHEKRKLPATQNTSYTYRRRNHRVVRC
ncbi:hypothetical protein B0H10DRAFT_2085913 [Mycena sp. CBHHK59/15]|nr:hypothetical protein B0H10DRAFT_2085913 [Mycena sp. CBHHK59/15]